MPRPEKHQPRVLTLNAISTALLGLKYSLGKKARSKSNGTGGSEEHRDIRNAMPGEGDQKTAWRHLNKGYERLNGALHPTNQPGTEKPVPAVAASLLKDTFYVSGLGSAPALHAHTELTTALKLPPVELPAFEIPGVGEVNPTTFTLPIPKLPAVLPADPKLSNIWTNCGPATGSNEETLRAKLAEVLDTLADHAPAQASTIADQHSHTYQKPRGLSEKEPDAVARQTSAYQSLRELVLACTSVAELYKMHLLDEDTFGTAKELLQKYLSATETQKQSALKELKEFIEHFNVVYSLTKIQASEETLIKARQHTKDIVNSTDSEAAKTALQALLKQHRYVAYLIQIKAAPAVIQFAASLDDESQLQALVNCYAYIEALNANHKKYYPDTTTIEKEASLYWNNTDRAIQSVEHKLPPATISALKEALEFGHSNKLNRTINSNDKKYIASTDPLVQAALQYANTLASPGSRNEEKQVAKYVLETLVTLFGYSDYLHNFIPDNCAPSNGQQYPAKLAENYLTALLHTVRSEDVKTAEANLKAFTENYPLLNYLCSIKAPHSVLQLALIYINSTEQQDRHPCLDLFVSIGANERVIKLAIHYINEFNYAENDAERANAQGKLNALIEHHRLAKYLFDISRDAEGDADVARAEKAAIRALLLPTLLYTAQVADPAAYNKSREENFLQLMQKTMEYKRHIQWLIDHDASDATILRARELFVVIIQNVISDNAGAKGRKDTAIRNLETLVKKQNFQQHVVYLQRIGATAGVQAEASRYFEQMMDLTTSSSEREEAERNLEALVHAHRYLNHVITHLTHEGVDREIIDKVRELSGMLTDPAKQASAEKHIKAILRGKKLVDYLASRNVDRGMFPKINDNFGYIIHHAVQEERNAAELALRTLIRRDALREYFIYLESLGATQAILNTARVTLDNILQADVNADTTAHEKALKDLVREFHKNHQILFELNQSHAPQALIDLAKQQYAILDNPESGTDAKANATLILNNLLSAAEHVRTVLNSADEPVQDLVTKLIKTLLSQPPSAAVKSTLSSVGADQVWITRAETVVDTRLTLKRLFCQYLTDYLITHGSENIRDRALRLQTSFKNFYQTETAFNENAEEVEKLFLIHLAEYLQEHATLDSVKNTAKYYLSILEGLELNDDKYADKINSLKSSLISLVSQHCPIEFLTSHTPATSAAHKKAVEHSTDAKVHAVKEQANALFADLGGTPEASTAALKSLEDLATRHNAASKLQALYFDLKYCSFRGDYSKPFMQRVRADLRRLLDASPELRALDHQVNAEIQRLEQLKLIVGETCESLKEEAYLAFLGLKKPPLLNVEASLIITGSVKPEQPEFEVIVPATGERVLVSLEQIEEYLEKHRQERIQYCDAAMYAIFCQYSSICQADGNKPVAANKASFASPGRGRGDVYVANDGRTIVNTFRTGGRESRFKGLTISQIDTASDPCAVVLAGMKSARLLSADSLAKIHAAEAALEAAKALANQYIKVLTTVLLAKQKDDNTGPEEGIRPFQQNLSLDTKNGRDRSPPGALDPNAYVAVFPADERCIRYMALIDNELPNDFKELHFRELCFSTANQSHETLTAAVDRVAQAYVTKAEAEISRVRREETAANARKKDERAQSKIDALNACEEIITHSPTLDPTQPTTRAQDQQNRFTELLTSLRDAHEPVFRAAKRMARFSLFAHKGSFSRADVEKQTDVALAKEQAHRAEVADVIQSIVGQYQSTWHKVTRVQLFRALRAAFETTDAKYEDILNLCTQLSDKLREKPSAEKSQEQIQSEIAGLCTQISNAHAANYQANRAAETKRGISRVKEAMRLSGRTDLENATALVLQVLENTDNPIVQTALKNNRAQMTETAPDATKATLLTRCAEEDRQLYDRTIASKMFGRGITVA